MAKAGVEKSSKARELSVLFFHIAPLLMRKMKKHVRKASSGKLTHPQYRILANIHRGLCTIGEIADQQGLTQPSMSRAIDLMVKNAWLTRNPDLKDRRIVRLQMTNKGTQLFLDVRMQAQRSLCAELAKLPAKDLEKLSVGLKSLNSFFNAHDVLFESTEKTGFI